MSEPSADHRPLSEKPLGYLLATGGGILGGPFGLVVSPIALLILNNAMKPIGEKIPNRFRAWSIIGIIAAPLSLVFFAALVPSNDIAENTAQKDEVVSSGSPDENKSLPLTEPETEPSPESAPAPVATTPSKPKNKSINVGDFTLSNISISTYTGEVGNADVAGELWVVYGDVTNNGNETSVPGYSLSTSIKDSKNRSFKSADLTVDMNAIVDEAFGGEKILRFTDGVLPGSTRENVQIGIYDVSPGSQGLKLCAGALFGRTKCVN